MSDATSSGRVVNCMVVQDDQLVVAMGLPWFCRFHMQKNIQFRTAQSAQIALRFVMKSI